MSKLGQYFTTNIELQEKVYEFILNAPTCILEPSVGQGDLVRCVPGVTFDMYEIDTSLDKIKNVIYCDFLTQTITKRYKTIIGNPPYVRTKTGNLYIDFTKKCFELLEEDGELIFIVPSDFFKLTCASKLLDDMMTHGTFTHVYHPHDEKMFEGASIDVIVYRYCKSILLEKKVFYNTISMYIINSRGLITFSETEETGNIFKEYFDVYVGTVSGKESVYKNETLGNIKVLNGQDKFEKYIYIEKFPCDNQQINNYLENHKKVLIERKIKKFTEKNWFEWGALRNSTIINKNMNRDCIYIYNLTRKSCVAFLGKVTYFGSNLLMLIPKSSVNLVDVVEYLNSDMFKNNFMFSGRFKIGHRQLCMSAIKV